MGTKELIDKIIDDARTQASAIRAKMEKEVKEIKERLRQQETRLTTEQKEQIKKNVELILNNSRSRARLECRKILLEAKWRLINRVCEWAKEEIVKSPDYATILKRLAQKYAGRDSTVHLSQGDKNRYGTELGVNLGEPVPISGGMIIRSGREEIDFSLDSVLNEVQEELITELYQTLFSEG
ncbi:MAG: V-type ATP synthase subunit E [bacterium]